MFNWYEENGMAQKAIFSEDVGAPELRNPIENGMRSKGLLKRLVKAFA